MFKVKKDKGREDPWYKRCRISTSVAQTGGRRLPPCGIRVAVRLAELIIAIVAPDTSGLGDDRGAVRGIGLYWRTFLRAFAIVVIRTSNQLRFQIADI